MGVVAQTWICKENLTAEQWIPRSIVKQQQSTQCIKQIANWLSYNEALVNHGLLTSWIEKNVAANWLCSSHPSGRKRGFKFSDLAIETALRLKAMFKLPLSAPDYNSIGHRAKTGEIKYRSLAEAKLVTG